MSKNQEEVELLEVKHLQNLLSKDKLSFLAFVNKNDSSTASGEKSVNSFPPSQCCLS